MTDLRKHMDPETLNMILFLKAIKELWAKKRSLMKFLLNKPLQVLTLMISKRAN
jgi:hypothetical protein